MAEATRFQSSIREAEERIMAAMDPCIARHMRELELRFETQFNGFQEAMRGIGLQVTDLASARRSRTPGDGDHRMPTRLTRLDFPKFSKDDVDSWIAKCERFFALDGTPEGERVAVASIAMDESSFRWFQGLEQGTVGRVTWPEFAAALRTRFGVEFESPMEELKRLVQQGNLEEYHEAFDNLACRTELSESLKLQCYLGGLNPELCTGVKMFGPRTLLEAMRIAKLQERSLELLHKKSNSVTKTYSNWSERKGVAPVTVEKKAIERKTVRENNQEGILGKPNYTFQKKLTPKEMDEHRTQNLCFFCHEKYTPGHDCPQRKKSQVFFMAVDGLESEELLEGVEQESRPEVNVPKVSLNALHGDSISLDALDGDSEYPMMRLTGWLGKKRIFVLIDTGSTHNFINQKLCHEGLSKIKCLQPVKITVADGGIIQGTGWCEGISWKMQGYTFTDNAIAIPLSSCDLILGMQWLRQRGKISWDFTNLIMEFAMGTEMVRLQAMEEKENKLVTAAKLHHMVGEDKFSFLLQILPCFQEVACCTIKATESGNSGLSSEGGNEELQAHKEAILQDYSDVFEEPAQLPPFRGIHDHKIILKDGSNPVSLRPYRYPPAQKDVIDKMVKELLESGVIQPSSSPFASPIVLVKKKDGSWRMCVDYRKLNDMTVKAKFPIPLVEDLLDELGGAKIFSKLDLRAGYHQLRMRPEDVEKTAFQTHSGQYEYVVMPFGLTNAPSTFQGAMNAIFAPFLRKSVLIFFDDILVYSATVEAHLQHLREVFAVLRKHSFYVKRSKCAFFTPVIEYLGHFISASGVSTDSTKIKAIQDWPEPVTIKQLRGFLGLTGYYRRFIKGYSILASPLTDLLRKDGFHWSAAASAAFLQLKNALVQAPVLAIPDLQKPFTVETDASSTGIGAVLLQDKHPVAFISKVLSPRNRLLSVYDRELLALVHAVTKWHQYLAIQQFTILTDQQSLKFLLEQRLSTPAQYRWVTKLMGLSYVIQYKRGKENVVADALSRASHGELFQLSVSSVSSELWGLLTQAYAADEALQQLISQVLAQPQLHAHYSVVDGFLFRKHRLMIPNNSQVRTLILEWLHSSHQGGHSGIRATVVRIKSLFFWKGLSKDVADFIQKCETCLRCKYERVASPGLLQPLPIPAGVWQSIAMDFIDKLPKSHGKDAIWVVIDRLSKYAHFIPLTHPYTASTLAEIFIKEVYRLHGAPSNIVSDRDPLFTSTFWTAFLQQLGISQSLTTAYHPQSDGQSEVLNRCLEHYLRAMTWQRPKEWVTWLPLAEWWYNTTYHSAIQTTPYEVVYGQPPAIHLPYCPQSTIVDAVDRSFTAREQMIQKLHANLMRAQARMKIQADKHRTDREFSVGDWVLLKLQPYRQSSTQHRASEKLSPRFFGPYQVLHRVGKVAYTLALPPESKIHPTFHVSLLKPCPSPAMPHVPLPLEWGNLDQPKAPFKILKRRMVQRRHKAVTEVLVQWLGEMEEEATWEVLYNLKLKYPTFDTTVVVPENSRVIP
uniref:Uncharacterized protein n=1 Tax=Lotus japonicus TaxID=34305 RepID=Q3C0I2_LOTJA|nr:hypothetical protein [Lotus japonicus]